MPSHEKEVIETHPKWYDIAEKALDQEDKILKSYPGRLDGSSGYLMISMKKILFVHEEGFLHKTYDLALEMPIDKILISHKGKYELDITDNEGKRHQFRTTDIPVSIIEKSL